MIRCVTAAVLSIAAASPAAVIISEVHPTGSSTTTYGRDFFELYNNGATAVDLTGWAMDDVSASFATSAPFRGITSLPAGARVVMIENGSNGDDDETTRASFLNAWFGATPPAGILVAFYGANGVGLGAGGDAVVVFNASGTTVTGVSFGAATTGVTFDNAAGFGSATAPFPTLTTLSENGENDGFVAPSGEIGSPGVPVVPEPATLALFALGGTALLGRRRG